MRSIGERDLKGARWGGNLSFPRARSFEIALLGRERGPVPVESGERNHELVVRRGEVSKRSTEQLGPFRAIAISGRFTGLADLHG